MSNVIKHRMWSSIYYIHTEAFGGMPPLLVLFTVNIIALVSLQCNLNLTQQKYNVNVGIYKKMMCMKSDGDGL